MDSGQNDIELEGIEAVDKNHGALLSELLLVKKQLKKVLEEHARAILKLQESEQKFKTVADYTYHWEYWLSPESKLLYNSPASERLTGYSPDYFFTDPDLFVSIVHPQDRSAFLEHRQCHCYTSEAANHIEFRIITRTGLVRWIAHSCQPVYDADGQFLGRRASNRNITEQKRIEEQVRKSEERLRLALDASSDGVWDKNLLLNEEYFGDNWHHTLGYTTQDIELKGLTWHDLVHPEDKLQFSDAINSHLEGLTECYDIEVRLRNKAGNWRWFLCRGKVVEMSESGQPLRIVGTNTDITKNKENELELEAIKETLEENVAEKDSEIQEVNVALKVLLTRMEKDKLDCRQTVSDRIEKFITPYLDKLQQTKLNLQQRIVLDTLSANVKDLTASLSPAASNLLNRLSPTEFQVANYIKHGQSTKEIAEAMHLSPGTISIHRKNIRKKLEISQQKVNLQAFLSSLT